ncbi:hypothetical protein [Bradyrhizobium sp.]|jgi:hypothetical protein|uniref:hypothetical protein n=1 Tax=Bradyrhizobium sp. TaxID=376 RepID=UPI002DDCDE6D|nr:hypothetical protein [Bradyrhizobium sp.]HEV2155341.1 hypothetical protein [Bradyrhizobium sp.]
MFGLLIPGTCMQHHVARRKRWRPQLRADIDCIGRSDASPERRHRKTRGDRRADGGDAAAEVDAPRQSDGVQVCTAGWMGFRSLELSVTDLRIAPVAQAASSSDGTRRVERSARRCITS